MKLIAQYRVEEFTSAVVPYVALKVAHGMVCLSESHRGINFHDVICARHYLLQHPRLKYVLSSSQIHVGFSCVWPVIDESD